MMNQILNYFDKEENIMKSKRIPAYLVPDDPLKISDLYNSLLELKDITQSYLIECIDTSNLIESRRMIKRKVENKFGNAKISS